MCLHGWHQSAQKYSTACGVERPGHQRPWERGETSRWRGIAAEAGPRGTACRHALQLGEAAQLLQPHGARRREGQRGVPAGGVPAVWRATCKWWKYLNKRAEREGACDREWGAVTSRTFPGCRRAGDKAGAAVAACPTAACCPSAAVAEASIVHNSKQQEPTQGV